MNTKELFEKINSINELNIDAMNEARRYQDSLAKPPHSLGVLEDLSVELAGISGKVHSTVDRCALLVFASDNGVVEEHVSSTPQSVTYKQTINLSLGKSGAATLSKTLGNDLIVTDVGVIGDTSNYNVRQKKIRESTNNIRKEAAMTYDEAVEALKVGFETIEEYHNLYDCFGIGEMGIGNTTTSSACLAFLSGKNVKEVVGKGAGLTEEAYLNKIKVIEDSLKHIDKDEKDILKIVSEVGGFDLISMAGAYLGCAYYHKPVVIDGFISIVAAVIAYRINPLVNDYLITSHESYEIGYQVAIKILNKKPLFNLNMRLGEGSGCPIAFSILKAACGIMNDMATFEESNINDDYLKEIRIGDKFSVKK